MSLQPPAHTAPVAWREHDISRPFFLEFEQSPYGLL
jgi:hypothetical protein